ncbi:MAG TPA: VOC family protein [Candidatus Levybacteria bacterium]|nr:VOC family protein [Candidatus Levybacteria bacterium]
MSITVKGVERIVPNLWFDHNAEEAVDYYLSIFKDGKILDKAHYPTEGLADFQKEFAGKVLTINFELNGLQFMAINAGSEFKFNESVSFLVNCKDQDEIDYYWEALTKDGGEESVCGWLKDKYGLSWQIAPEMIDTLVTKNPKAFSTMMQMKKIIIADIEKAAEEK